MQAFISSPHINISPPLQDQLLDCMKRIDLRYGDHVSCLKVSLSDEVGTRGGADTVCRIQAHLDHRPAVSTEGRSTDPSLAVLLATRRMERAIGLVLGIPAARCNAPSTNARTQKSIPGTASALENRNTCHVLLHSPGLEYPDRLETPHL